MASKFQDFSSITVLDDNFTQSNPTKGTFTRNNSLGLNNSSSISVSQEQDSDQVWTTKEGYTVSDNGEYVVSAFLQISAGNGYGALGFSIESIESNIGNFSAPGGWHLGVFFHNDGGGFLNNGAITTSGSPSSNATPINWNNGGIATDGSWHQLIFTAKTIGRNQYDLNLKIYKATADAVVGSLITEHSMTDDLADPTRVGPAVTNTDVGTAKALHVFFSSEGSRVTTIDNLQTNLAGDALLLEPGPPLVDLNGSEDGTHHTATFIEVAGVDDRSAAVSFTTGAPNLGDLDSSNLNNLKVSIPVAHIGTGDQLLLDRTTIDLTSTRDTGEISYNGTVFKYTIVDTGDDRIVSFVSLNGSRGADTPAPIASYETLLDSLTFNNTADTPETNPTRVFSVTADDSSGTSKDANFTVTLEDAKITYDKTTFIESIADDGSIINTVTLTLMGDTFTGPLRGNLGTVANTPAGLTATLVKASDTSALLSLIGNATTHTDANDVDDLTVKFSDTDFTSGNANDIADTFNNTLTIDFDNFHDPFISSQSAVSVNEDAAIKIDGFTVSDDDNPASLTVKLDVSQGNLSLETTTGIRGTTSGRSLEFSGSISDLNTALNSLTYQGDTEYSGSDEITIQVSDDYGATWHGNVVDEIGKFYYPLNEHYYEYVSAPSITWADAKAAAEARTLYGLNGYLVTVTSATEDNYIAPKLGGSGWMGGSDDPAITSDVRDEWYWVTGPEAGTQFWSGKYDGAAVNGQYSNWAFEEPNDYRGTDENYAHFWPSGTWNDYRYYDPNIAGYVVEYGGNNTGNDGFGTVQPAKLAITINNVNDIPVIGNLGGDSVSGSVNQIIYLDANPSNSITDEDTTNFNGGTLVITTTSGTADGDFSLDGINANSGGDNTIAANESIEVGGTTIGTVHTTNDGQGGNTLTITLNSNATPTSVSQFIQNIGYTSTTASVRNFNLALSESDGTTANASLEITLVNDAPVINNLDGDSVSATVNRIAYLDANPTNSISDTDSFNYDGGSLVITTTSGTADGNFSLDGTNAVSGGDNIIAANESIEVGGTTIGTVHTTNDGQGGNTLTITLNSNATPANIAQLIQNIGFTSGTSGIRNFNLALSESDGTTTNVSLAVEIISPSIGTTRNSTFSLTTIDGVSIQTSIDNKENITASTTTTIPIITHTRIEDPSTEHPTHADIPLVTDHNEQTILKTSLPIGIGLSAEEFSAINSYTLRELLIAASDPKVEETKVFDVILQNGIDPYVETVFDESQVIVRTVTFNASDNMSDHAAIITGALGTGEDDLNHPHRQEALVIDTRHLPPDTELQFNDIEFAIVVGSGRIVSGNGRNFVIGDDADQFIVLGEGNDILRGGLGDDTIGSKGGNDQLFGDEGHDYLIGGIGHDTLDGGTGNDLLQGGQSDAGTWTFSLNDQNQVVSTFTIHDSALSTASTPDILSSWFYNNVPITNDNRVAFVYQDPVLLETISTLYQAVFQQLPTTEELNYWTQRGLFDLELAETAYQAYLNTYRDTQTAPLATQMTQLIHHVWGDNYASHDWINKGLEYINNGGQWNEILLFMARHNHLKQAILDDNGDLKLTQNLQTNEVGWSTDTGNDTLNGGQGDDTLIGGHGHNLLNGGPGIDSVVVTEKADPHYFMIDHNGRLSFHRHDEKTINDLIDVEHIVFSDQTLDVSASNLDATSLKNMAGLAHLINETTLTLDNLNQVNDLGMTTIEVARALMTTDRYLQHWGLLSNSDFVGKLSGIVLGTPLTGDDLAFWTNQLDQKTISREEVLSITADVPRYQDTLFTDNGVLLL